MVCIEKRPYTLYGRLATLHFRYLTCLLDRGHIITGSLFLFFYYCLAFIILSRSASATSSLLIIGSSSTASLVITVTTLVSVPNPAPATLTLLATIISRFFFVSFTLELSSICSVSIENPHRNNPSLLLQILMKIHLL